jgi:hypothetical protein
VNREDSLIVYRQKKSNLKSNSDRCFDCAQSQKKVKKITSLMDFILQHHQIASSNIRIVKTSKDLKIVVIFSNLGCYERARVEIG